MNRSYNRRIAAGIDPHPELLYEDYDGSLRIDFDYDDSDVRYHLSNYAPITRQIIFNISFPERDDDWSGPERISREIAEIIEILNDEFYLYDGCEVTFWLSEHDFQQISCAVEFRELQWQTMFEYWVGGECQDRVDIHSNWYAELVANYSSGENQNDSDDEGYTWDTDSD